MEIAGGIGQMYGDNTVLSFSDRATPLPLDARVLSPFFTSLVSSITPIVLRGVVADNDVLQALPGKVFIPMIEGQEALQISRRIPAARAMGSQLFSARLTTAR